MKTKNSAGMSAAATEFLQQLDISLSGNSRTQVVLPDTAVVSLEPFSNQRLRGRVLNRSLRLPLKIARRATRAYRHEQKEIDQQYNNKLDSLERRVELLESKLRSQMYDK